MVTNPPVKAKPITRPPMPAQGPDEVAKIVRSQAAARSHNVFRPDVYRVSEGYLN